MSQGRTYLPVAWRSEQYPSHQWRQIQQTQLRRSSRIKISADNERQLTKTSGSICQSILIPSTCSGQSMTPDFHGMRLDRDERFSVSPYRKTIGRYLHYLLVPALCGRTTMGRRSRTPAQVSMVLVDPDVHSLTGRSA